MIKVLKFKKVVVNFYIFKKKKKKRNCLETFTKSFPTIEIFFYDSLLQILTNKIFRGYKCWKFSTNNFE